MLYKQFKELNLSRLGMGCMRLPIDGPALGADGRRNEKIDEEKALAIIDYAYNHGVNYFDTAFRYHGGESEIFIGKALNRYPRDTWYLASKLPGHMMSYQDGKLSFQSLLAGKSVNSIAELFEEQLGKCGVDYFDFYLLHNVCETAWDFYTDEELGVVRYLVEQRDKGRIRHLGFSAHGRADCIERFLDWSEERYGKCFGVVQIQLNYLDWTIQEAGKKYELLTERGIPVIVMEGCRGGRLASLGEEPDAMLKNARPNDSIASWAFRFLQSLPNVQLVLSGMNDMDQITENIETFSKEDAMTDEEKKILDEAVKPLLDLVPCTACRYCIEACPQKLDIPKLISMYNEVKFSKSINSQFSVMRFTLDALKEEELPGACIGCGACVSLCPQGIDIPGVMREASPELE